MYSRFCWRFARFPSLSLARLRSSADADKGLRFDSRWLWLSAVDVSNIFAASSGQRDNESVISSGKEKAFRCELLLHIVKDTLII